MAMANVFFVSLATTPFPKPEEFYACDAMIAQLGPVLGHQINMFE